MHRWTCPVLAHSICKLSGTRLDPLDKRADSEVVWLEPTASHQMEEVPSLSHVIAAHIDIDEGVEGHISGFQADLLHPVEELLGSIDHLLLCAAFDQRVVRDFIYMEEVTGGVFLQKLYNLNGFLHLLALNATV